MGRQIPEKLLKVGEVAQGVNMSRSRRRHGVQLDQRWTVTSRTVLPRPFSNQVVFS